MNTSSFYRLAATILTVLVIASLHPLSADPTESRMMESCAMLWSILKGGSQMGPGSGWFKPGQSRYDWKWLAERCDADKDGKIQREEFPGNDARFGRFDRNKDGVLSPDDLDWSANRQPLPPTFWFRMFDQDGNGKLTSKEWETLFERAAKGKGYLTTDDLRETFPLQPPPRPAQATAAPPADAPTRMMLFKGLLDGEIGSFYEGPKLGDKAPAFTLTTYDGKRTVSLEDFKGRKPVVLVFGSFT